MSTKPSKHVFSAKVLDKSQHARSRRAPVKAAQPRGACEPKRQAPLKAPASKSTQVELRISVQVNKDVSKLFVRDTVRNFLDELFRDVKVEFI